MYPSSPYKHKFYKYVSQLFEKSKHYRSARLLVYVLGGHEVVDESAESSRRRRRIRRQRVGVGHGDGAFQRVDGGAETVAQLTHFRGQFHLMIVHEGIVDDH